MLQNDRKRPTAVVITSFCTRRPAARISVSRPAAEDPRRSQLFIRLQAESKLCFISVAAATGKHGPPAVNRVSVMELRGGAETSSRTRGHGLQTGARPLTLQNKINLNPSACVYDGIPAVKNKTSSL